MQTEMLHLRLTAEELKELRRAAEKCDTSANSLGAHMIRAALSAVRDYDGPFVPLTLEFPHKINIEPPTKLKK